MRSSEMLGHYSFTSYTVKAHKGLELISGDFFCFFGGVLQINLPSCLWTLKGNQTTWRKATMHGENM